MSQGYPEGHVRQILQRFKVPVGEIVEGAKAKAEGGDEKAEKPKKAKEPKPQKEKAPKPAKAPKAAPPADEEAKASKKQAREKALKPKKEAPKVEDKAEALKKKPAPAPAKPKKTVVAPKQEAPAQKAPAKLSNVQKLMGGAKPVNDTTAKPIHSWKRGADGNYTHTSGEGALKKNGKTWEFHGKDGSVKDLGKKASFDHADKALTEHMYRQSQARVKAGVAKNLAKQATPRVMQKGKRGGSYYVGEGGRKVYAKR